MEMVESKRGVSFAVAAGFLALAGVFGLAAVPYVERFQLGMRAVVGIYGCFLVSLTLAAAPGVQALRPWIRARLDGKLIWLLPLLWCSPYLLYAAGTGDFRWAAVARLLGLGALLVFIYRLTPVRDLARFAWQDLVVAVWLIAALMTHQLSGIWNLPVNLDFMGRLFLISVAAWSWVFLRPVPKLGYEFRFSWEVGRAAAWNFLLFIAIAIPAGLALRFIEWHPLHKGMVDFAVTFLEIFLFIALLEEMFFRGFLQTLISENLRSPRAGQVLISCLFGLFHILHAPFPNWKYVLLATVAGWFYGSAFMQSGTLMASALTHALVDTMWRTFFSKS